MPSHPVARPRPVATRAAASVATLLLALSAPALAAAQERGLEDGRAWLDDCRSDGSGGGWRDGSARACDLRVTTLRPTGRRLAIDGGQNGGITVRGWDREEIRVEARLQAHAERGADAEALLRELRVRTDGGRIVADGPSMRRRESWAASFVVWVPRRSDLALATHNGGIAVHDVEGQVRADAVNGGLRLARLAGDVEAFTQNGGVDVSLHGDRWRGERLDVETRNGGVRVWVPERYSARLETGTVNGTMSLGFPVTVQGRVGRQLTTQLGSGGALVRAVTTNGAVRIEHATDGR